ncbi:MAG: hypothetical protein LBE13_21495 [Bacteroidales bacterium]|nr:hypothetical protein [Bacteroidales bacterium]
MAKKTEKENSHMSNIPETPYNFNTNEELLLSDFGSSNREQSESLNIKYENNKSQMHFECLFFNKDNQMQHFYTPNLKIPFEHNDNILLEIKRKNELIAEITFKKNNISGQLTVPFLYVQIPSKEPIEYLKNIKLTVTQDTKSYSILYNILFTQSFCNDRTGIILIPCRFVESNKNKKTISISKKQYFFYYKNKKYILKCPLIKDGNNKELLIPSFYCPHKKYPICVYLHAAELYSQNPHMSYRQVEEIIKKIYKLPFFNASTVLRAVHELEYGILSDLKNKKISEGIKISHDNHRVIRDKNDTGPLRKLIKNYLDSIVMLHNNIKTMIVYNYTKEILKLYKKNTGNYLFFKTCGCIKYNLCYTS